MIQSMVARLAERLEAEPGDADGWRRLSRAYHVLGETANAKKAAQRAQEAETANSTKHVNKSKQSLVTEDQSQTIKRMVNSLAVKLKENPDDFDGWIKLARSYDVLGSPMKARMALRQGLKLRPDDVDVMTMLASNLIEASDRKLPLPKEPIKLFHRILRAEPDNLNALYFTGLAAAQQGNTASALKNWTNLLQKLSPNSDAYSKIKSQIDALEE
jgi:cytochrome c-type biogenesis protein CcmH